MDTKPLDILYAWAVKNKVMHVCYGGVTMTLTDFALAGLAGRDVETTTTRAMPAESPKSIHAEIQRLAAKEAGLD
jgi:hypothetical protein